MKFFTLGSALCVASVMSVSAQNIQVSGMQAEKMQSLERRINLENVQTTRKADIPVTNSSLLKVQKKVAFSQAREAGVTASYKEPEGLLSLGIAETTSYFGMAQRRGGAFVPYTFTNTSTGANNYEWVYWNLAESQDSIKSNATDLSYTPGFTYAPLPTLTAWNGDQNSVTNGLPERLTDQRVFLLAGGSNTAANSEGDDRNFGAMTYPNLWYSDNGSIALIATETSYPFDEQTKTAWAQIGLNDADIQAYGNFFPKPISPYYITKMWAFIRAELTKEISLQIKLYEVTYNEDGTGVIGDVIATGETIVNPTNNGIVTFNLFGVDEDGFETEDPITIRTAILAEISGFNGDDGVRSFSLPAPNGSLYEAIPTDNGYQINSISGLECHAVLRMTGNAGGQSFEGFIDVPSWYYGPNDDGYYSDITDFFIMTDAVYAWLYTNDSKILNLSKDGGEVSFDVHSYWPWEVGALNLISADGQDDSWLKANVAQIENGLIRFTFSADKCEAAEGRKLDLILSGVGCPDLAFTVNQGAKLSINGVEADKDVKAVEYYDVMGRKLNAQPENGIFIRKAVMTDGSVKTAKVAK